jgi:hypothetical protein
MIKTLAQLKFKTHAATVSRNDDGRLHIFKYGSNTCDFEIFDCQFEASDWLLTPPEPIRYQIIIPGESE